MTNRCGKTIANFTDTLIRSGVPAKRAIEMADEIKYGHYYGDKPCTRCGHRGEDHDHDWSDRLNGPDIFRCEVKGCKCEKYTDWEDVEKIGEEHP